jgi:hypothetical protein
MNTYKTATELALEDVASRPVYYCGLDLGQSRDYSAFCTLERVGTNIENYIYQCRFLHRWQLKTRYTDIVEDVLKWTNSPTVTKNVQHRTILAVDQTGCGAGVVDLFRRSEMRSKLIPVMITAGSQITKDSYSIKIPKRELVGAVAVALQNHTLRISPELPLSEMLVKELENFNSTVTDTGHTGFGAAMDWRVGNNDDLVLSVSMALWCAANGIRPAKYYSF